MPPAPRYIAEQFGRFAYAADYNVHAAIAVEVREGGATAPCGGLKLPACLTAGIREDAAANIPQQEVWMSRLAMREVFYIIVDRAARRVQVLSSVVVEIVNTRAPAREGHCLPANLTRIS